MRRHIRRTRNRFFKRHLWKTRFVFWFGAILVGLIAAIFALMGEFADLFFREHISSTPWLPFIVTPLGLVCIAWLTRNIFQGAEGSGIPQTLISLQRTGDTLCQRLLSIRVAIGKVLLTV